MDWRRTGICACAAALLTAACEQPVAPVPVDRTDFYGPGFDFLPLRAGAWWLYEHASPKATPDSILPGEKEYRFIRLAGGPDTFQAFYHVLADSLPVDSILKTRPTDSFQVVQRGMEIWSQYPDLPAAGYCAMRSTGAAWPPWPFWQARHDYDRTITKDPCKPPDAMRDTFAFAPRSVTVNSGNPWAPRREFIHDQVGLVTLAANSKPWSYAEAIRLIATSLATVIPADTAAP